MACRCCISAAILCSNSGGYTASIVTDEWQSVCRVRVIFFQDVIFRLSVNILLFYGTLYCLLSEDDFSIMTIYRMIFRISLIWQVDITYRKSIDEVSRIFIGLEGKKNTTQKSGI